MICRCSVDSGFSFFLGQGSCVKLPSPCSWHFRDYTFGAFMEYGSIVPLSSVLSGTCPKCFLLPLLCGTGAGGSLVNFFFVSPRPVPCPSQVKLNDIPPALSFGHDAALRDALFLFSFCFISRRELQKALLFACAALPFSGEGCRFLGTHHHQSLPFSFRLAPPLPPVCRLPSRLPPFPLPIRGCLGHRRTPLKSSFPEYQYLAFFSKALHIQGTAV